MNLDVVLAPIAPAARAMFSASKKVAIVAQDLTNDPVVSGYAVSYAHPGRNVTGVFLDAEAFGEKWVEILRDALPELRTMGVLWDPAPGRTHLEAIQRAAKKLNIKLRIQTVRSKKDFEPAFKGLKGKVQGLVFVASPLLWAYPAELAQLALRNRLPAIFMSRHFAEEGGLLSYGPDMAEVNRRNAAQVDRILRGTPPGDIPIERPSKYTFEVNLQTARALGIELPQTILLSAEIVDKRAPR
jgi:putative ABC transport system substrate-binding protein